MSSRYASISYRPEIGHMRGDRRRTGILEAEAVGRAPKGEEPAIWLDGADEPLEELSDILLDGHLLRGRQELDDELE